MAEFSFAERWYEFVIMAVICYLVGSFNFAKFFSALKHKDISRMGSGNPGTMNMTREFGLKLGALTFFCDALKGAIPCIVAYFLYRNEVFVGTDFVVCDLAKYVCGLFVVIGHIYPFTSKNFQGGKGIASTLGLFWAGLSCENLWFLLIGLVVVLLVLFYIVRFQWGSVGSLIGVTTFGSIQATIFTVRYATISTPLIFAYVTIFVMIALTWFAHRKNLVRLLAGEEHRTKLLKKKKKNV